MELTPQKEVELVNFISNVLNTSNRPTIIVELLDMLKSEIGINKAIQVISKANYNTNNH